MRIVTNVFLTLLLTGLISVCHAQEETAAGLYNDGLALLKAKDYKGGLALMEKALELAGPEDEKVVSLAKKNGSIAAYNAGNKLLKSKTYDEALAMFQKGTEYDEKNSSNFEGIARSYEGKGNQAEAIKAYLSAAEKGRSEGKEDRATKREKKAQNMVAKLYIAKDYDQAIAAGEAFLSVKSDNPEVHYFVGKAYAAKEDSTKAQEHAAQAVKISGDAAPDKYHYALATAFENTGNIAEAIASYKLITGEKYKKQAEYKITTLQK